MRNLIEREWLLYVLMAIPMYLFFIGCDDNEDTPPITGGTSYEYSVKSEKSPSSYSIWQTSRSSDNFSTAKMTGTGTHIEWLCENNNILFNVRRDISDGGYDTYYASDLYDKAITKFESNSKFYIADPKGTDKAFTVGYRLITIPEGEIHVGSRHKPLYNQNERSSRNFNLNNSPSHYRIECIPNLNFKIKQDTNSGDPVIVSNLRNGVIIKNPRLGDLYIADPNGVSAPFTVKFIPIESIAWMEMLDGNKYLYELSIPGTHDSGTGTADVTSIFSKCQHESITVQLKDGMRFLDIRLNDELLVYHGIDYCGLSFKNVLDMCNSFLESNPNETILMSIKPENSSSIKTFNKEMIAYFKEDGEKPIERIVRDTIIPQLKDVRGKIVMFRRFDKPDNSKWGINIKDNWPEDGSKFFTNDNDFYVQDRYFSPDDLKHDTNVKADSITIALEYATGSNHQTTMVISFASMAFGLHTPWEYAWGTGAIIETISPIINHHLSDEIDKHLKNRKAPVRFGTIPMDFYNKNRSDDEKYLVEKIINSNFAEDIFVLP